MTTTKIDHFFRYDELTQFLQGIAKAHPDLVQIDSIGKSYEGRDIWVATVTNQATGPAREKPAMLVDGNIHATEVTASAVACQHIATLVEQYGNDPDVTRCLDTRAFYVVPRLNPDGAEHALADKPRFLRSSTRAYPYNEDPVSGMIEEDIDGDGRILSIRVRDPNGRFKKHPDDARLMIPRDPTETGGEYYRLLPEGRIENYDGVTITPTAPKEGLDLNRNWPSEWRREHVQPGAGPFPLSEPETHAMAKFVSEHPNIFTWIAGHTFSGVLLRAGFTQGDDKLPMHDLEHYKLVGKRGTELSGYPAVSVYHDFRVNQQSDIYGSVEWGYQNFGIYVWAPEYWAPHRTAGVEIADSDYAKWFFNHEPDDVLKMIRWNDEKLDGKGFVDWYEFEHPQLGTVEIGGWDVIRAIFNPPEALLADEIAPFSQWFTWQLLMSPKLELIDVQVTPLGSDHWRIRTVAQNTGYLPSVCSQRASELQAVRGTVAEISLPDGASLLQGEARMQLGQLGGRAEKPDAALGLFPEGTDDRVKVEWTVQAPAGSQITVVMRHDRAGLARQTLTLA